MNIQWQVTGIAVDTEATPYSVDISVDGIVSASNSAIWFRGNGGSVTIGEDGVVRSALTFGIVSFDSSTEQIHIGNAGQVIGAAGIITGAADDRIDNSGTIRGLGGNAIIVSAGNDTITNSGRIVGNVLIGGRQRHIHRRSWRHR